MTACLRCDGVDCSKYVAENDDDLGQWWRIARYGFDFVIEPKAPQQAQLAPSITMHSTFVGTDPMDMVDAMDDDVEAFEDFYGSSDEPSDVILHFCSSRCLASWAQAASALE